MKIPVGLMVVSIMSVTVGTLPMVMMGAALFDLGPDLGLGPFGLGVLTALFFLTASISSPFMGRWVEKIGWKAALTTTAGVSAGVLLLIGSVVRSLPLLFVVILVGSAVYGMANPAANLALSERVDQRWQATGFGIKHAAIPLSTLLAGLSVPVVVLAWGWEAAYLLATIPAALMALIIPTIKESNSDSRSDNPKVSSTYDNSEQTLPSKESGSGKVAHQQATDPSLQTEQTIHDQSHSTQPSHVQSSNRNVKTSRSVGSTQPTPNTQNRFQNMRHTADSAQEQTVQLSGNEEYENPEPAFSAAANTLPPQAPTFPVSWLVFFSLGASFATWGAIALGTYTVPAGVEIGLSEAAAGWLLFIGSLASILTRVLLGILCDLRGWRGMILLPILTAMGALVFAGMTWSGVTLFAVGTVLAFMTGWGWPGLLTYVVVRLNPESPAATSAISQSGIFLGAGLGPLLLGWVAEQHSFASAWWLVAVASAISAGIMSLVALKVKRLNLQPLG